MTTTALPNKERLKEAFTRWDGSDRARAQLLFAEMCQEQLEQERKASGSRLTQAEWLLSQEPFTRFRFLPTAFEQNVWRTLFSDERDEAVVTFIEAFNRLLKVQGIPVYPTIQIDGMYAELPDALMFLPVGK